MSEMTWQTALKHARYLYTMWVSAHGEIDLDRIHASMLQDYQYRRGKPEFAAVCRDIRGQFVLLGKVRKALDR